MRWVSDENEADLQNDGTTVGSQHHRRRIHPATGHQTYPKDKKKDPNVLLTEKYNTREIFYKTCTDSDDVLIVSNSNSFSGNVLQTVKMFFQEIFLPQGYPSSVSSDYTSYQIWDTAQAFCSTITGTLSTHAVMKGVGVGDTEATPLAATITWVLKDGTGHVGRILFAWWKGTSLDADSKKWRLFADVLNDAAICLEVALPYFYGYTTYVLCISTAMKSIVGVTGGATRVALTQHQALRGNLADVAAKDGSQETAVNLIASFTAIFIISIIGQNIWPIFLLFTTLHIFSNLKAVSSVCLNTFNATRYHHCIHSFVDSGAVLRPEQVNKKESVSPFNNKMKDKSFCGYKIKLGSSLQSSMNPLKVPFLHRAISVAGRDKYFIIFDIHKKVISIILKENSTSQDILLSYYHAVVLDKSFCGYKIKLGSSLQSSMNPLKVPFLHRAISVAGRDKYFIIFDIHKKVISIILKENSTSQDILLSYYHAVVLGLSFSENNYKLTSEIYQKIVYDRVHSCVSTSWPAFKELAIKSGWNLEKNLLICDEWRAHWPRK